MPQRYYLGRSDESIKVDMNSDTFQERKKTLMKNNLEIREVETKLNSNWLRPNIKEKDIDEVRCEGKDKRKWAERKEVSTSKGLRQVDPLSPLSLSNLFQICGEGLSTLMRLTRRKGKLKGVKASQSGPSISHLLFADELTNSNKRKCRKEIISNTFTMVDAGKILRLPLDAIPQEDEITLGNSFQKQKRNSDCLQSDHTENVDSTFAAEAHSCLEAHVHRTTNTLVDIIATESLKQRRGLYLERAVPRHAVKTLEDEWVREPDLALGALGKVKPSGNYGGITDGTGIELPEEAVYFILGVLKVVSWHHLACVMTYLADYSLGILLAVL
ncbi:hypothetical protein Goshw_005944 [Gossypium schwendimanii]|uniref:Uncharacterized protein n=1 Tax=Gossypium schwendimanii TaxID=34291 RepID=A0A7J9L8H1_GOSSC|nr:hypothetical protein [Gossypium schwendimanii]